MYKPVVPLLEKALRASNTHRIIDLGSGGGGGLIWLNEALRETRPHLKITLTGYYPNLPAFEHNQKRAINFEFEAQPVDARNVPAHLDDLRTQFLSLHHFKPADAQLILQNAVDKGKGIAIFEAQERSAPSIIAMLFSPLTVIFTTPFIRPFKLARILFTYLIPIVPLFVLWNGIVSALRTYSVKEMKGLIAKVAHNEPG